MGSITSKLERLNKLRTAVTGIGLADVVRGGAVVDTQDGQRLRRVRERMGALLDGITVHTAAEPGELELPFAREQTAVGTRHVRVLYHGLDEPYGEVRLGAALDSRPEALSLLALDPKLSDCRVEGALFLDTETTGLGAAAGHVAFLVGMAWFDERRDRVVLEQLLLRDLGEELALLERVRDRIAAASMLVTYNGKSFDLPVLRCRFVMSRVLAPIEPPHFDLLHVARRVHKHRRWRKNLQTVEQEVLGFHRGPDVGGEEVAMRYLHYLRTSDASLLGDVVEHNRFDVLSLVALMGVYGAPLDHHDATELAAVATTVFRAGAREEARRLAEVAVQRERSAEVLLAHARIAKATGDRQEALNSFEELAAQVDDPEVWLELAKLYEHHVRDPSRALEAASRGTSEDSTQHGRRTRRLQAKIARG